MKKYLMIFVVIFIMLFTVGCDEISSTNSISNSKSNNSRTNPEENTDFLYEIISSEIVIMGVIDVTVESIIIPNTIEDYSVVIIHEGAFNDCSKLTSITIPSSVKHIDTDAFSNCYSLTSITVDSENTIYKSEANCLIEISTYTLVLGCKNSIIPSTVENIGDYAFYNCTNLTSIPIPDGITNIGNYSFSGCNSSTFVTIPDSVKYIDTNAFSGCFSLASITVDSENNIYKSETNCLIEISTNTLILGCKNSIIPSTITSIGNSAFKDCSTLTSIAIPDSVTSIGDYAFASCSSLTSITIPDSVTTIGDSAFSDCNSIASVSLPDSSTSISFGAVNFEGCSSLTYNTYDNAKYLGNETNNYLVLISATSDSISSCSINENCESISDYAFSYCTGLTSITIPNNVTTIGDFAFGGCTGLTSITIPNGVTSIGEFAFASCSSLTSITIPNGVTSIGNEALSTLNSSAYNTYDNAKYLGNETNNYLILISVTSVSISSCTINENCKIIDRGAFSGCTGLTSIIIPNGVTSIGEEAFGCRNLTSITIPDSIISIGDRAFSGCSLTYNIYDNAKYLGNDTNKYLVLVSATSISISSCTINENCKIISQYAFSGCISLTSITIPNGVTSIEYGTFDGCSSLTFISISNNITSIASDAFFGCGSLTYNTYDNAIYLGNDTNNYLVLVSATSYSISSCTINENCKIIMTNAFIGCGLNSITIPNSVVSIGYWAFSGCSSLTSITIPSSVKSMGDWVFCNCKSLTSITIRENTTLIKNNAFSGCSGLTSITIPSSVTSIGSSAFSGCTGLTINAEATSKPSGWNSSWNSSSRPVVWGYQG